MNRNHHTPRRDIEAAITDTERAIRDARIEAKPVAMLVAELGRLREEHAHAGGGEGVTADRLRAAILCLPWDLLPVARAALDERCRR